MYDGLRTQNVGFVGRALLPEIVMTDDIATQPRRANPFYIEQVTFLANSLQLSENRIIAL